jgi:hypothetical protein
MQQLRGIDVRILARLSALGRALDARYGDEAAGPDCVPLLAGFLAATPAREAASSDRGALRALWPLAASACGVAGPACAPGLAGFFVATPDAAGDGGEFCCAWAAGHAIIAKRAGNASAVAAERNFMMSTSGRSARSYD